jgi:DNA-binding XRE family transcriptional regulator
LEYRPQHISIGLLAQRSKKKQTKPRRRQIHPENGPERAFGLALREFRKATGISQEQFALDGGFDRTYISLLERGISSPTVRALFKLAQMLRVAPSEIVMRTEALVAGERTPPKKRTVPALKSR